MGRFKVVRSNTVAVVGFGLLVLAAVAPKPAVASGVVGTGDPSTCTEAALNTALSGGGAVTFNCGASPFTLTITTTKVIGTNTNLNGGGLITLSGGGTHELFSVNSSISLSLDSITITGGGTSSQGGAIYNSGTVNVTSSTVSGNTTGGSGGAIYNSSYAATVNAINSTFSGNNASSSGGAIYNNNGTVNATNSTFSGNTAGSGGAIYNYQGTVNVISSTFSGNSASTAGGGGAIYKYYGTVGLWNTIVANSSPAGGNCGVGGGSAISGDSHNLRWPSTDMSCVGTFGDPKVAALANNGGPTQTMALQSGSAAINAGDNTICQAGSVNNLDQRGYVRPGNGSTNCSIGAYEYNSPGKPQPTGTPTITPTATPTQPTATPTVTPTVTLTLPPTLTLTPTLTPPPALVPGSGKNPCMLEWFTEPITAPGSSGLPLRQLTCTDDNPLCDFGTSAGDNACTFHVALCLNVADSRLQCTPSDVAHVQLVKPSEAKPKDAGAAANRDALEAVLTGVGGTVGGLCANSGAHKGQLCQLNADCDASLGSGDGVCKGRLVVFDPPLSANNRCTQFAAVQVPLIKVGAKASVSLVAKAISDPLTHPKKVTGSLKLTCKPHS